MTKNIKKLSVLLVVLALVTLACSTMTNIVNENTNTNTNNTANNDENNTQIDEGDDSVDTGIAPHATARPIVEDVEEPVPGEFISYSYGISTSYPKTWEVIFENEGTDLIGVTHPSDWVYMMLNVYPTDADNTIEELVNQNLDDWAVAVDLTDENARVVEDDYAINGDYSGWRGLSQWAVDGFDDEIWIEIMAFEHEADTVFIVYLGWEYNFSRYDDEMDTFRQDLTFFPPAPRAFGVDRSNAFFIGSGEPDHLDPALWTGSAAGMVGDLFSGLVRLDTNLQPIADLAERWEVSADGTEYTFYLRENVTFHSGRAFTAADVKYSWERAMDPALESPTVQTYMGDIVGAQEIFDGEATELAGLEIIDDYTIRVTLDAPKAYFLYKLAYPTSWIVDQETAGEVDDNPIGTGPFRVAKYEEGEVYILERNPFYHLGFVPLEYVVYVLYPGSNVRAYETGEIDLTGISDDFVPRAEDPSDPLYGQVLSAPGLCTYYAGFDTSKAPFDDINVRKAFAMVIDKALVNDTLLDGKWGVADGIFPPGLPGYNADVQGLDFDIIAAREFLAASEYADAMPEIVFTASGVGDEIGSFDATFIEIWERDLGVDITVDVLESSRAYEEILAGNHGQIIIQGWCADYPDPENFADVLFHSESYQNSSDYGNAEVDAMLEAARSEPDLATRLQMYADIEQMLIDDVAAVFLFHSPAGYVVVKEGVNGYVNTPIGVAQNMNITIEP